MSEIHNDIDKNKKATVFDIMEKSGKYQMFQFMLICLPAIFVMMSNVNYVFVVGDVNYRCRIPECESLKQPYLPTWWPDPKLDRCSKPILNRTLFASTDTCTNEIFTGDVEACTEWTYESRNTIVAEFNLGCQLWKQNMVGTIHGLGMIVAMLVAGWMSDRFGRKLTIVVCSVGCCLGSLKALATSYPLFVVLEFLEAAVSGGVLSAGSVLIIEISTKRSRLLACVVFAYALYTGEALYACLSMAAPHWKTLVLIIYIPSVLFISYMVLLNESPRWQMVNGKISDAKTTLITMAKSNNVDINVQELDDMDKTKLKQMFNLEKEDRREGYKEVIKSKEMLKRLVVGFVCRFSVSFIYYSLVVNSVYLPGDKYTNFLLTSFASYPGELLSLYLMRRYGRKSPLICGFLICGAASISSEYIPDKLKWAKILIFLIEKLVVATCFTGMVTYTMELFPTSVRGSLLGLCTLASCAGNMLAPLVPSLKAVSPILPIIFFACSSLGSSALLLLTPETCNLPLMDTIKQVVTEDLIRKEKKRATNTGTPNVGFENHE